MSNTTTNSNQAGDFECGSSPNSASTAAKHPPPISIEFRRRTSASLADIVRDILIPENWTTFTGWGPLPGIRSATFEHQTPEVAGTRVRVVTARGDSYVETITHWEPEHRLVIRMDGFARPLNWLAKCFVETWTTEGDLANDGRHTVIRRFELYPRRTLVRPLLRVIGLMLRKAAERHSAAVLPSADGNQAKRHAEAGAEDQRGASDQAPP